MSDTSSMKGSDGFGAVWGTDNSLQSPEEIFGNQETDTEENRKDQQDQQSNSKAVASVSAIVESVPSKRKRSNGSADIVFLVDVTGSMEPCIDALKRSIKHFLHELANGSGEIKAVEDWRARIVGYRDYPEDYGTSYGWLNECSFTRTTAALEKFIDSMVATGGGDEPESLLDAISVILDEGELPEQCEDNDKRWRTRDRAARILVVFTDATYHEKVSVPKHIGETFDTVADRIMNFGIHGFMFVPDFPQYEDSFGEISNFILQGCGSGADGLGVVMSNPEKLREILYRLQKGISRSASISR